jgi:hypothetical protein
MTLDSEAIHLASRNLMIAGFTIALLANAWRRHWGFVLVLLLAIFESYERYRFLLHTWSREQMVGVHPAIGVKEVLQSKLIYVGAMAICALVIMLIPYVIRANAGRRLMVLGSLTAIMILGFELISPHRIDLIMYHTVMGLFALSAVIYFCSALLIAGGAILDRRRVPVNPGSVASPPD